MNKEIERLILANAMLTRIRLHKALGGGGTRKDVYQESDLPDNSLLTPQFYKELYDREGIATRVVRVLPMESWAVQPAVYEDENEETETDFEAALKEIGRNLRGGSLYEGGDNNNPLWELCLRADILSGIGSFGVILLGIDDGLPLSEPAEGVEERGSGVATQNYSLTYNAKSNNPTRKLLFVRAFDESLVTVARYETNPNSPRYGHPVIYTVTLNDPADVRSGIGLPTATVNVHWSRIVHIADNLGSSELFGVPRMRPVINQILGIQKISCADPEMHWANAFPGLSLETNPQLGGDVRIDLEALKDMTEDYREGLQRVLFLAGMQAKTLSTTVADPTSHINTQIQLICIQLEIPQRIFMGSERGELASTQDKGTWNERMASRQANYLTPRIITPVIDRLINLGVLPTPEKYKVWWPSLTTQTEAERYTVAGLKVDLMAKYLQGGVESLYTPMDFLTRIVGETQDDAESILQNAMDAIKEEAAEADAGEETLPNAGTGEDDTGGMEYDGVGTGSDDATANRSLIPLVVNAGYSFGSKPVEWPAAKVVLPIEILKSTKLWVHKPTVDHFVANATAPAMVGIVKKRGVLFVEEGDDYVNALIRRGEYLVNAHLIDLDVDNAFCPTGPGGGIDPSCSPSRLSKVLDEYSGSGGSYKEINSYLRGKTDSVDQKTKDDIAELDRAFEEAKPIDEPITVYRGVDPDILRRLGAVPGDYGGEWWTFPNPEMDVSKLKGVVMEDKGFMSTSTRKSEAEKYNSQTVLKIKVPKGTKVIDHGFRYDEAETLLNRGTRMKITGVSVKRDEDGYWKSTINVTVVKEHSGEVVNAFCPTGPGGGIDPSCSPSKTGSERDVVTESRHENAAILVSQGIRAGLKPRINQVDEYAPGRGIENDATYVSKPGANKGSFGGVRIHYRVPEEQLDVPEELKGLGWKKDDPISGLEQALESENGGVVRGDVGPDRIQKVEVYEDGEWKDYSPKDYLSKFHGVSGDVPKLPTIKEYRNKLQSIKDQLYLDDDKVEETVSAYAKADLQTKLYFAGEIDDFLKRQGQ